MKPQFVQEWDENAQQYVHRDPTEEEQSKQEMLDAFESEPE